MYKTYKSSGVNTNHFWLQIVAFTKKSYSLRCNSHRKKAELEFQLCSFGGNGYYILPIFDDDKAHHI